MGDQRLPERFWQKVGECPQTGCWLWVASVDRHGYGQFGWHGAKVGAHRLCYLTLVGPTDLPLDHLCRVHNCVNPAHLEPVTPRENFLRGVAPNVLRMHADTCKHGHSLDDAWIDRNGTRRCRSCNRERAQARREAERAERGPLPPREPSTMCLNGHVYAEVGVYQWGGKRMCRECRREADHRRHAARKAADRSL